MRKKIEIEEIKSLIKRNDEKEIRKFIKENNIEFKNYINEDFNILDYIYQLRNEDKISSKVKNLIIKYLDRGRQAIIEIIKKNDFNLLKAYCKNNKIYEFKQFSYLPYLDFENLILNINIDGIKIEQEIKDYVTKNYTKERSKVMSLMFSNNKNSIEELIQYLIKNEIETKDLSDKYFNIVKYFKTYNKNNFNKCFEKIKTVFDENYFDKVEINKIKSNYALEKYIKNNFKKFENLKNFNVNDYLKSIKYIDEKKINILIQYYDKPRRLIIDLIIKEDIPGLSNYIQENNDFEFKELNKGQFDIISYCKFSLKNVSNELMDFILINFDKKRREVISILEENVEDDKKIQNLKNYVESSPNNFEIKDINDKNFDIIKYCHSSKKISSKIEKFVLSHLNSIRYKIVEWIKSDDNKKKIENFIRSNNFNLKELNDDNFDIIKYIQDNKNGISPSMKTFIKDNFDSNRNRIMDIIKKNDVGELKEYMENNNIELEKLNHRNFNIVKFVISLHKKNKISEELKDFVISHLNIWRSNIIELIEEDNVQELKDYIKKEKNFQLNDINDTYFNLKKYCKKYKIVKSPEMKHFLKKYSNKEKYINDIIRKEDNSKKYNKLKKYVDEFDYGFEFKESNKNIVINVLSLYDNQIIDDETKNYILLNYDIFIINIIKFMYENKQNELSDYISKNFDRFKDSIDIYYLILKYSNILESEKIPQKIKDYILKYLDRRKEKIKLLLKEGNRNKLKLYIINYRINISEIDDENLIEFYSNNKEIPEKMIFFLKCHYTYYRSLFVEAIINNQFEKLDLLITKNNIWPVNLNDQYFKVYDLLFFNPFNYVTHEMCYKIIMNYYKERSDLADLVKVLSNKKKIKKENKLILSDYANKRKLISKSPVLNDEYFDFINYLFSLPDVNNYKYIKCYFFSYYNKEINKFVDIIKNYQLVDIKKYINDSNIEFHKVNYKYIKIIKYLCNNLSDIKLEVKEYILNLIDKKIIGKLIKIIKKDNPDKMKQYLEKYEIEMEHYYDNIKKDCKDKDIKISKKMKKIFKIHYDENTYKIVQLINNNDVNELKIFLKKKNVELKQIKMDLIKYSKEPTNGISDEMKFFIVSHWDKNLYRVMELISCRSLYQLKQFMNFIDKDFEELNGENFNIIEDYLNKNGDIEKYIKEYIISHENKLRGKIVDIIKSKKSDKDIIFELKKITEKHKKAFIDINDNNFDIVEFCKSKKISQKIIDFIRSHFTLNRYRLIEIIENRSIRVDESLERLKDYVKNNNIYELKLIDEDYDDDFKIIEYCKKYSIPSKLRGYIINNYYKERGDFIKIIEKLENQKDEKNEEEIIDKFDNYIKQHNIEFEKFIFNDKDFNIIKDIIDKKSIKKPIKSHFRKEIIHHYNNERWKLIEKVDEVSNKNISIIEKESEIKEYIENNDIELKNHIDEYFDIIDSIDRKMNHELSEDFKTDLIYNHNSKNTNKIINLITNNNMEDLKKYLYESKFQINDINNQYFDFMLFIKNEFENIDDLPLDILVFMFKKYYLSKDVKKFKELENLLEWEFLDKIILKIKYDFEDELVLHLLINRKKLNFKILKEVINIKNNQFNFRYWRDLAQENNNIKIEELFQKILLIPEY